MNPDDEIAMEMLIAEDGQPVAAGVPAGSRACGLMEIENESHALGKTHMGRVIVQFELSNNSDIKLMERGYLTPDKIRKVAIQGVVDTGSARLVLPAGVAQQLGLPVTGQATIRYADHRRELRDVVGDAHVQLLGRGGVFSAVVEPARSDALLGRIVMRDLDLVVDGSGQHLEPRDPNRLITEVE